jgi:type VI secretion system protein ImpE
MVRMSPIELFHEARLTEALAAQKAVVATGPDDVSERLLLCELLAFTADRDAIRTHLERLAAAPAAVQQYVAEWRALLHADDARHAGQPPDGLPSRTAQIESRLRADSHSRRFQPERALDLLDDADEAAPWLVGHVDGRAFDGWRDADDLLGPVLEVFRGDRFCWVDLGRVRKLRLEDGHELRDIVYRPATLWLVDGDEYQVFIPGLYVDTAGHPEDGIGTGAGVDWVERGGVMRGLGSRTYLFGEEELTLSEFRQVEVRG